MTNATTKPAHEVRDDAGRYAPGHLCDACNRSAGTDPMTDDEVCAGGDAPGFVLCERAACVARRDLGVEARRALYAATVATRKPAKPAKVVTIHAAGTNNRTLCGKRIRAISGGRQLCQVGTATCPGCLANA